MTDPDPLIKQKLFTFEDIYNALHLARLTHNVKSQEINDYIFFVEGCFRNSAKLKKNERLQAMIDSAERVTKGMPKRLLEQRGDGG